MATDLVRGNAAATNIAIIQAVGGTQHMGIRNVTGFYIDTLQTCIDQLGAIPTNNVSIMWDSSNDPSGPIQTYLHDNPAGHAITFLTLHDLITTPGMIDNTALSC
jgi:hypothetical protein